MRAFYCWRKDGTLTATILDAGEFWFDAIIVRGDKVEDYDPLREDTPHTMFQQQHESDEAFRRRVEEMRATWEEPQL